MMASSTRSETTRGVKRKRAYGISCLACRAKKVSCDGARPKCGGCRDTEEDCQVPASARPLRRLQNPTPPKNQVPSDDLTARLVQQLQRIEDRMERIEEAIDLSPVCSPPGTAPPSPHPVTKLSQDFGTTLNNPESEYEGARYRLTVDDQGNVVYHGLTSWVQGPNVASENHNHNIDHDANTYGMAEPALAPIFQALATSKHISVAPKLGDALLETFFCYQVFNIIQRSTFLRDMAFGGPMFSEFLLMSMYASATRMFDGLDSEEKRTQGELFQRLAKEHLAKEMDGPSKVTTIQGLLLLSGRECALGHVTQGWNHAGLAFRMIQDLGIHLDPEKVAGTSNLSLEEQATRDRLFWVAFIWDKSISLAMGREPTFAPRAGRNPNAMADFDDDDGPWTAYYANPLNAPPQLVSYVYQPTRRVATFRYLARLCLILHDIIIELYSAESRLNASQRIRFTHKTRKRLEGLWESVPETMKFNPSQLSPPPWVFMFQMLYHASNILVYRVLLDPSHISTGDGYVGSCLEHSISANQMAVSFTQTFGQRMAYVAMYSSFVAASFDIMLLEAEKPDIQIGALMRLRTWLGIMETSVVDVPSIRRSVHHISKTTWNVVSKHSTLSNTEAARWIGSLHSEQQFPGVSPESIFNGHGTGVGAFDFFELFDPV